MQNNANNKTKNNINRPNSNFLADCFILGCSIMIELIYKFVPYYKNWSGEVSRFVELLNHDQLSQSWRIHNKMERELCRNTMLEF